MNQSRARRRCATFDLPVLEDANSIQVALMQIMRLLAFGHLDVKSAGLFLYALQTASSNLARTTFEPDVHDVILDPRTADQTLLEYTIWDDADFEEEEEEPEEKPFVLSEKEKEAILYVREKRAQAERDKLIWANSAEERASIKQSFSPNSRLRPEDSQALLTHTTSKLTSGPAAPAPKAEGTSP